MIFGTSGAVETLVETDKTIMRTVDHLLNMIKMQSDVIMDLKKQNAELTKVVVDHEQRIARIETVHAIEHQQRKARLS